MSPNLLHTKNHIHLRMTLRYTNHSRKKFIISNIVLGLKSYNHTVNLKRGLQYLIRNDFIARIWDTYTKPLDTINEVEPLQKHALHQFNCESVFESYWIPSRFITKVRGYYRAKMYHGFEAIFLISIGY